MGLKEDRYYRRQVAQMQSFHYDSHTEVVTPVNRVKRPEVKVEDYTDTDVPSSAAHQV